MHNRLKCGKVKVKVFQGAASSIPPNRDQRRSDRRRSCGAIGHEFLFCLARPLRKQLARGGFLAMECLV